jgi:hypothetical protein
LAVPVPPASLSWQVIQGGPSELRARFVLIVFWKMRLACALVVEKSAISSDNGSQKYGRLMGYLSYRNA